MPLSPGSSRETISKNIREFHTGKTYAHTAAKFGPERARKQAIAVALSEARKSRDEGGSVQVRGPQGVGERFSEFMNQYGLPGSTDLSELEAYPVGVAAIGSALAGTRPNDRVRRGFDMIKQRTVPHRDMGGMVDPNGPNSIASVGMGVAPMPGNIPAPVAPGAMGTPPTQNTVQAISNTLSPLASGVGNSGLPAPANVMQNRLMARGGGIANRAFGGFDVAHHPRLGGGWEEHQEARQMHTGPVLSAVPGRTDHHPVRVPSGSYVVPSDIVSGRGQGNTLAGMQNLQKLFKMGPYGTSPMSIHHGAGPPRPPHLARLDGGLGSSIKFHSGGGKGGEHVGVPTPVNIAGGELVIPPENLIQVVHNHLPTAHRIMDSWVLHERKKLRKTLAKLPGPAKD